MTTEHDEMRKYAKEALTRTEKATPGEWGYSTCYGVATIENEDREAVAHAVEYLKVEDADFIAAAKQDVPKLAQNLIDVIDTLEVYQKAYEHYKLLALDTGKALAHSITSKERNVSKVMTLYIDGVNFQHELGEASDGTIVYPSLEGLKSYSKGKCWEQCGVVKVTATFSNIEWVVPQDFKNEKV